MNKEQLEAFVAEGKLDAASCIFADSLGVPASEIAGFVAMVLRHQGGYNYDDEELAEARREAEQLRSERDKLQARLDAAKIDHEADTDGWADQCSRITDQLLATAKERDGLRTMAEEFARGLEVARESRAALQKSYNAVFREAWEAKQERDKLREALSITTAALTRLRDCDWTIGRGDRMDPVRDIAREALEKADKLRAEALKQ